METGTAAVFGRPDLMLTNQPPGGAFEVKVTVPVAVWFPPIVVGLIVNPAMESPRTLIVPFNAVTPSFAMINTFVFDE